MKYIVPNKDDITKPFKINLAPETKQIISNLCLEVDLLTFDPLCITENQKLILQNRSHYVFFVSWLPEIVIFELLKTLPFCTHYAFCTHYKDYDEKGILKKIHTHIILYCDYNSITLSTICYYFHTTTIRVLNEHFFNEWNYLIHDTEECRKKNKTLYKDSERICDDFDFFKFHIQNYEQENKAFNILNDLLSGYSSYNLVKKYGFAFLCNYDKFYCIANKYTRIDNDMKDEVCKDFIDENGESFQVSFIKKR